MPRCQVTFAATTAAERAQTAAYIRDLLEQLSRMARAADLGLMASYLEMGEQQADMVMRLLSGEDEDSDHPD